VAEVKDAPLTEQELAEVEDGATYDATCSANAPDGHPDSRLVLRLVAEVRRLRTQLAKHHTAGYIGETYTDSIGAVRAVYKPGCPLGCDER
jgi:hypothetical protein